MTIPSLPLRRIPWNPDSGLPPVQRALFGLVANDTAWVYVVLTDIPSGAGIVQASFTAKLEKTDPDDAPTTVQKVYRSDDPVGGFNPYVQEVGSDGTSFLIAFPLDVADTEELLTEHGYGVRVWVRDAETGVVVQRTVLTGVIQSSSGWTDLDTTDDDGAVVIRLGPISFAAAAQQVTEIAIGAPSVSLGAAPTSMVTGAAVLGSQAMESVPTGVGEGGAISGAAVAGIGITDDIAAIAEQYGLSVPAYYDARTNVRAVGSVVGVLDDARCATADGQVFVPESNGNGLLTGDVTNLNGLAGVTIIGEIAIRPGAVTAMHLFARRTGSSPTGEQISLRMAGGDRIGLIIGDGAAVLSEVRTNSGTFGTGTRYRFAARFDGTQATDALKCTFFRRIFDPLTQAWGATTQLTSNVITAGVPAALVSITSNCGIGRVPDTSTSVFRGVIGGSGETFRVFGTALTDAEIDAELASDTPVLTPGLSYNFSGATPYANLGSWGASGDATPGADTVLCSGDRSYCGLAASITTQRPTIASGPDRITFNGTAQYLRNTWKGKLESITGACAAVWVGTMPTYVDNDRILMLSVTTQNALSLRFNATGGLQVFLDGTAANGATIATAPTGVRVITSRRTSNVAGTAGLRNGTLAEVTGADTPQNSGAITRYTIMADAADTPARFSNGDVRACLLVAGTTAQVEAFCNSLNAAYWGAAFHGASI